MESLYPPIYVFLAGINQGTGVNMMIFDLRLFSLVLCICCCLVKSGEMKEKKATIFHMCDADQDLFLTVEELEKCLKSDLSNYDKNPIARANPSTVIALMDTDKDGRVSLAEYLTVVDNVSKSKSNSGMIEVIDRYGEKKMVSADEMWDRINAGPQDLKMENDHMVKETEGKTTMDKLAKENPQVNNIVTMAKWGLHILVMNEIVSNTSKIGHVRSLPVGGHNNSINENSKKLEISRENIEMNGRFEVWLEVTLESPPIVDLNSNGRHVMSQSTCYEVCCNALMKYKICGRYDVFYEDIDDSTLFFACVIAAHCA